MTEHLVVLPILLFSVVVHELAHGWVALQLGDPTARDMGRLTLNPIPHIDLVGSIIVPLLSLATTGGIFIAWAKPVPVNPANFRNARRGDMLVSAAGPLSNLVLAGVLTLALAGLLKLGSDLGMGPLTGSEFIWFMRNMLYAGITLNVVLAVFNLLPVPPLDGSHVLASLLPAGVGTLYRKIGFAGIFLILMLMNWEPCAELFGAVVLYISTPYHALLKYMLS